MLGRYAVLLLLGKGKPWKGLAMKRKKAKATAGRMRFPPRSGHEPEAQRHQGLAETSPSWLLARCWCSAPGLMEEKEPVTGFLHAAEAGRVFGRAQGIKPARNHLPLVQPQL